MSAADALTYLQTGDWTLVAGAFDPLTAEAAQALVTLRNGRKLMAAIFDNKDPLLPASARAILVAALRVVDAVFVADPATWSAVLSEHPGVDFVSNTQNFIDLVLHREQAV